MKKPQNVIVWFDVPTLDFERARKFYSTILGNEVVANDQMGAMLGFFPMEGTMGVGGDLVPPSDNPEMAMKPALPGTGVHVHFSVEGRLDEALSLVEKSGGKIIKPKYFMNMVGWLSEIEDTEGNRVGLYTSDKK